MEIRKETVPSEACVWWEGGTPAEACAVYPELFSHCFLAELSVCMRRREGETACVYVREAEGGDATPPPVDWASLTGWRGRWGHCNKANTHTHIFFLLRLLCPRFSFFPASALPSFHNLLKNLHPSQTYSFTQPRATVCPSTFHLSPLPTLYPNPFLTDCMLILTCSH